MQRERVDVLSRHVDRGSGMVVALFGHVYAESHAQLIHVREQ